MERDRGVIEVLNEIVARKPRWGFWKLSDRLRLDGQCMKHKRLHRVYCAIELNLPRRTKRRLPTRIRQPWAAPAGLNQIWALDFMADALYGARAFRTLNLIDEGNRQMLGIEVAHSIPSLRVIRVMEQLTRSGSISRQMIKVEKPAPLFFRHASTGTKSLNTILRSSRLLLPVLPQPLAAAA
jgi:putative transposase